MNDLRNGLLERGVDFMSFTSCVTSCAHTPALIDEAIDIFDETLADLILNGVIAA